MALAVDCLPELSGDLHRFACRGDADRGFDHPLVAILAFCRGALSAQRGDVALFPGLRPPIRRSGVGTGRIGGAEPAIQRVPATFQP
ncbi:hypothetical protein D3C73_1550250 [compost metagenome]